MQFSERLKQLRLSDELIDKIFIYPDNRIEIAWKMPDFCENPASEKGKELSA